MPIYEYECERCGKVFPMIRQVPHMDAPAPCPKCEGLGLNNRRVMSESNFKMNPTNIQKKMQRK